MTELLSTKPGYRESSPTNDPLVICCKAMENGPVEIVDLCDLWMSVGYDWNLSEHRGKSIINMVDS